MSDIATKEDFDEAKLYFLKNEKDKKNYESAAKANICRNVLRNMTLEPSMLLFSITFMLTSLTTQNLSLEKACRIYLNLTEENCTSLMRQELKARTEYEKEIEDLLATALAWRTYLIASVPGLMSLFAGAWSDKTGQRKFFFIIVITGQILISVIDLIQTFFFKELDMNVLILSEALIESLSGGWCIFIPTIFSYISSLTKEESRTFRMGIIVFLNSVGFPVGTTIAGVLLRKIGYYGNYGIALTLNIMNLFYILFFVKDTQRSKQNKQNHYRGLCYFIRTFFDITIIKEIWLVVKKSPKKKKIRIYALLAIINTILGPVHGELAVMYMTTRYRYSWDEVQFSFFQSYYTVMHTIGTVFSITVFSKIWQWDDSMLGIISTVSKIAGAVVYCLAPNGSIFYLGPFVDILSGTALLAARSMISKLVTLEELGKTNALMSLMENFAPLLYIPFYMKVYTATREVLPGAVFLIGTSLSVSAIAVFSWMFYEHRQELKNQKIKAEVEMPLNI